MLKIKTNSKNIKKDDIFIAIKGHTVDGHNYIEEAINNGASKIICEHGKYSVETINVDNTKNYLKEYLEKNYSDLFKNLIIIGVTGTNGKTTTAYLISSILTNLGINNTYIGTIGYFINSKKIKDLDNTTPDILELYNLLIDSKNKNIKYIVIEVSSHSLDMDRLYGIKLDCAIFTNLTEEHLNYHKTMDNYLKTKLKIINLLKDNGYLIINNEDKYSKYFDYKNKYTVGFTNSDFIIKDYTYMDDITKIDFKYKKNYSVKTKLKANYNVLNYMEALVALYSLNFKINDIIDITHKLDTPPGRLETYKYKNNYIIIDYAHTPDAVEKVIKNSKIYNKKIITIIGCGGSKDVNKRPIMGKLSTTLSDYVIFTSDNPRFDNPDDIINDMTSNLNNNNYEIIKDRKQAIIKGISMLDNNVLLILGKGHEEYQIIKNTKYHFSDKEIVLDYIEKTS